MEYKVKATRTKDYVGSVQNPYTDEYVLALKAQVRRNNAVVRAEARSQGFHGRYATSLQRVAIKPRGPRAPYAYHTQIKDAIYFDVYLRNDTDANWNLRHEFIVQ